MSAGIVSATRDSWWAPAVSFQQRATRKLDPNTRCAFQRWSIHLGNSSSCHDALCTRRPCRTVLRRFLRRLYLERGKRSHDDGSATDLALGNEGPRVRDFSPPAQSPSARWLPRRGVPSGEGLRASRPPLRHSPDIILGRGQHDGNLQVVLAASSSRTSKPLTLGITKSSTITSGASSVESHCIADARRRLF